MSETDFIVTAFREVGAIALLAYTLVYLNKTLTDLKAEISKLSEAVSKCPKTP